MTRQLDLFDPRALTEIYQNFKDKPREAVKKMAFDQGVATGQRLIQEMNIEGSDTVKIASILKIILKDEPMNEIEIFYNKVRVKNEGFCPMMYLATSLEIPWDWLCGNVGWPFFHGLGAAVVPDVDLKVIQWRRKGDPYCDHVYEIK